MSVASAVWSGGPNIPAATQADLLAALSTTLHDSSGSGSGSVDWTFGIPDKDLDFLNQGETLTVTYDVVVKDNHSGVSNTQTVTVTITGADDPGFLYFSGDGHSGQSNPDLFRLDVNGNLTSIPVNPGHGSFAGEDGGFIQFANDLYFFANKDGIGNVLFRLDASGVATAVLDDNGKTIADPGGNVHFTIYDGSLYFGALVSGHGDALVQINPTGAVHVFDTIAVDPNFNGNFYPGERSGFAQFDGGLYFSALDTDGASNPVLFKLGPDGTLTHVDYQGGSLLDAGIDGGFASFNGGLFFNAADPANSNQDVLFKLDANGDPTPVLDAGGQELNDLSPGGSPANLHAFDGSLYLTAFSFDLSTTAEGLFKVDANGAVSVLDYQGDQFDFTTANQRALGGITDFNGNLYFSADTATTDLGTNFNPALFRMDGNGTATEVLYNGAPITDAGEDGGFVAFNGHEYFFADSASGFGSGLYQIDSGNNVTQVSDPTDPGFSFGAPGTTAPGQPGPDAHFTVFDGNLYFEAQTGKGTELVQIDSSGVARVIDVNPDVGPPTGDGFPGEDGGFAGYTPIATAFGTAGNDHLTAGANTVFIGGKGNDTISGAGSHDTAVIDANFGDPSTHVSLSGGVVTVTTTNGTDTLTGIDRIQFADKGLLIVDPTGQYGFASVQAAVNAATAGDTIWVLPGTYTESTIPTGFSGTAGGLFINTPNLTLQGVEADGTPITSVSDANKATLPTIVSGHETDFGSNIFVGPNADNTVIEGLHLQAGPFTTNKVLEIWANNVTVEDSWIDANANPATYALAGSNPSFDPLTGYTGAAAIYFNDNGTPFTDEIAAYTVAHNILDEGIVVANGVGVPSPAPSPNQVISGNTFEGTFDVSTGLGRYDTIVLNGKVPGIGWLLESTQIPTIIGNQFGDNTTPFLLRGSDISAANLPTSAEVAAFLAANGNAGTTYAYVETPKGDLELALRNPGPNQFYSFAVANTIDTLNLALDTTPDNVFPDQRIYMQTGDTVIVQSGPNALSSAIDVDGLKVLADADSAHLTLTLGTALPDGTPVSVRSLTLLDYGVGHGANVNVTGNDLGDTIVGNHGDNVITTGGGNDTITGGGGNDTITSGGGNDTIIYNVADGGRETVDGGSGTDTQIVNNVGGSAETFNIGLIDASHLGINIEPGANNPVPVTGANYEISDTGVEEIVLHLGNAGDTVLVSGNLGGTGVLTSTITVDGGTGNDTVNASAIDPGYPVDVVFTGGGGNDSFTGGPGADTIIYNVADGGRETVAGGTGIDTQIIDNSGSATAETFDINPIDASHLGVNIVPGAVGAQADGTNYEISDTGVEEIVVRLGAAGDHVVLSGDLSGTGVATSTITIQGGAGDDTVDLSKLTSNEDVVFDGAGQADSTGDTAVFGFAYSAATYSPIFDTGGNLIGVQISYGSVTDTITNVENFQFTDGTRTVGGLFPPTANPDTASAADTASQDAGTVVAHGNAITDVGDSVIGAGVTLSVTAVNGQAGDVGHDVSGTYGTLHLNADGSYTYTANAALDALHFGQNPSDVFGLTVGSSDGGSATTTLTFNITGANDTPVVVVETNTAADTAARDAGSVVASGNALAGDSDRDSGVTFSVADVKGFNDSGASTVSGATVAHGIYGDLTINPDGSYSYTANAAFDALPAGVSVTDVFDLTAGLSNGDSAATTLTFSITGANDNPVVVAQAVPVADTPAPDAGNAVASGNLLTGATDAEGDALNVATIQGSADTAPVTPVGGYAIATGTYGSLVMVDSRGDYYYVANAAFDALTTGQTGTDAFTYTVSDGNGGSATTTLTFTITGANETAAVVSGAFSGSVTEDASYSLPQTDLVTNGGFENAQDHLTGWTYTPANGGIDGLSTGYNSSYSFIINTGFGSPYHAYLSQPITTLAGVHYTLDFFASTVLGTGNTDSLAVTLNGQSIMVPLVNVNDGSYDNWQEYKVDFVGTGATSTLQFDLTNGQYWALDDISVKLSQGTERTSGTIGFSDADVTHHHAVAVSYVGNHNANFAQVGTFTATETQDTFGTGTGGTVNWNFAVADSALQALAGGESVVQTYQVTISDGLGDVTTQNVDVTLNGVNDAPVLTVSSPNLATISASQGTFPGQTVASILSGHVSDVDDGALQGIAITGASNAHGAWQYSTDGGANWTNFGSYSAGSALLLAGTDLVRFKPDSSGFGGSDTFSYVAWDQTSGIDGHTVSTLVNGGTTAFSIASDTAHLTVTGLDQPPIITSAPQNVIVTEDASYATPVNLVQNGGFEASPNYLGWTVTKTLPSDTTSTYTGHNGGAGAYIQTGGNGNDVVNFSQSFATTAGVSYAISFWVSNAYYYSGGNFIDVVWNGNTVLAEINIPSTGGYGNFVEYTVNVAGTGTTSTLDLALHNPDSFILDDVSMLPVVAPGTETTGGLITFTDGDVTDTHTMTVTPQGSGYLGTFTPVKTEANGIGTVTWTYTVNDSAIEYLGAGQTVVQTYRVTIDDGHGGSTYQDVNVTLTGVNDAPVLTASNPSLPTLIAGPGQAAGETVATLLGGHVSDADAGALQGIAITGSTGSHGAWQYSIDGGAHWSNFLTYSASSALLLNATDMVRFQPDGTTYGSTDTFSYVAWDQTSGTHATTASTLVNGGTSAFSSVSDTAHETVTGFNQPPIITSGSQSATITEDASYQTPPNLVTDGGFENSFTGWTVVTPAGDYTGINTGRSGYGALIQTMSNSPSDIVKLSESLATTAGTTYTVTFWVSNPYYYDGNFVDVLWNGSTVLAVNNIAATGSQSTFNPYTVTVVATGATSTFELDLHNSDDFFLDDVSVQAVTTPGTESSSGKITFTDGDPADTHTIAVTPGTSGYLGTFTPMLTEANGTGTVNWTFNVSDAVLQSLGAGQTLTQTYTVAINDGHGGIASQPVIVTLTGVNDAPVLDNTKTVALNNQSTGNSAPSGAVGTLVSQLVGIGAGPNNVTDADSGAKAGIAITAVSTSGISGGGTWYYSTNNGVSWSSFGSISTSNALLLAADANTRVYFKPNSNSLSGSATITFDAWDQSSGSNGTKASASTTGGTSAFSTASDTASVNVGSASTSPVNLSSSNDTVYFISGTNTVNAAVTTTGSSTATTLNSGDSLIGGSGIDTLNLTVGGNVNLVYGFNFALMTGKFVGFDNVVIQANPAHAIGLTFGNPNILSGQTLTVDGHLDTTQSFSVDASGVTDGGNVTIVASGFSNNLVGGSGNDLFQLTAAELIAAPTIHGNAGTDTLQVTDTGFTITDAAFANVLGVEIVKIGGSGADILHLGANASTDVGGAGHTLTVDDSTGTGNLTVDGSAMTADLTVLTGSGTTDTLTGGSGNDTFAFNLAHFHGSAQSVTGGAGNDTIWITDATAITVTDADLANVLGVETLKIGGTAADSVTLGTHTNLDVGGIGHSFTVDDSAGTGPLTVDGSAMTANLMILLSSSNFTASDHLTGGAGSDIIQLVDSTGIVVTDAAFTHVSGIETLQLGGGSNNSVTLGANADAAAGGAGHGFTVDGSAGTGPLSVNGSAMTANLTLVGGAGNDTLIGGSGNDTFIGGGGNDTLTGGAGANVFKFGEEGAANLDRILDFSNAKGDSIDISALLGAAAGAADSANIGHYVNFATSGNDLVLQVDTTGNSNFGGGTHDVATLAGYAGNQHIVDVVFNNHAHQMAVA